MHAREFRDSAQSVFSCPLVFDTGASADLSPFKSDFSDGYKSVNIAVKGFAGGVGDHWRGDCLKEIQNSLWFYSAPPSSWISHTKG